MPTKSLSLRIFELAREQVRKMSTSALALRLLSIECFNDFNLPIPISTQPLPLDPPLNKLPSPLPLTATWKRLQHVPFVAHTFPIHAQRGHGATQYACTYSYTHLPDYQRHGEGEMHPGTVIWFVSSLISSLQIVFLASA